MTRKSRCRAVCAVFPVLLATLIPAALLSGPAEAQVLERLTDTGRDDRSGYTVDDDGSTVVVVWRGDPFGTNPDHVQQIYRYELPEGPLTALTSYSEGWTRSVSITDDGVWIVFDSTADPKQENGDGTMELFRMRSDGSEVQQLTNDRLLGGGKPSAR